MTMPAAILFDYGGVLTDVHHVDAGFAEVAATLSNLLSGHGSSWLANEEIEADLRAGATAYESWKQAQSRFMRPRELSHEEFWELVVCDWPGPERDAVLAEAAQLCAHFEFATLHRPAKADARAVLMKLRDRGIRTALVCNCLSGDAARRQMKLDGLSGLLDVELFSDETGLRKPNPGFVLAAVDALGTSAGEAWFVGDKLNRDVLGARRAGLAKALLMSSPAGPGHPVRGIVPDVVIDSPTDLLALVT